MANECEYCGKTFTKLSQLYMHKNTHTPSLLLHQHPHPAFGIDATKQLVPVREHQIIPKRENGSWKIKDLDRSRKDPNINLGIVDTYDGQVKRKRDEHDSGFEIADSYDRNNKKQKYNEFDPGLQALDSYDRVDKKIKRGIKKNDRIKSRKYLKYLSDNEERNPKLKVVDKYEKSVKRKRDENDSDLEIGKYERSVKRKRDENDSDIKIAEYPYDRINKKRRGDGKNAGLQVVVPYDRIENKRKREIEKNNRIKNRKFKKFSDDDDDDNERNFKEDHKKCEKEKQELQKEIEVIKQNCNSMIENEKEKSRDKIKNIKDTCRDMLETKDKQHKADIAEMGELFEKELKQKENIYKVELDSKEEEHEDEIKTKIEEFEVLKKEFEEKIDMLIKHKKWENEEEENITPLAQAIFNCTTIGEIFEIENLIKSQRINELQDRHYKTLQNMFLSLNYGILPICQPQRNTITESQRRLVEKIQGTSKSTAKKLVLENREEIANLFSIIEDSLVLARNSFNRYGNR